MLAPVGLLVVFLAGRPKPTPTPTPPVVPEIARAIAEFEARYPPVEVNPAALELESLAAELGIDLAPPVVDRPHPAPDALARAAANGAGAYLSRQIESDTDAIEVPPEALREFLLLNAETMQRTVGLLAGGEMPRWALDVRLGAGAPGPNFMGHVRLQKLLVGQALVDLQTGQFAEASRVLEASWILNQPLIERPDLISKMVAISVGRWQAGALRKGAFTPTPWVARLRFDGLRSSVIASLRDDAVGVFVGDTRGMSRSREMAAYLSGRARLAESLASQDPCGFSEDLSKDVWKPFFPGGPELVLAGIALPNQLSTLFRLYRLLLEAELSASLLELRALRSSDGSWPERMPDLESRVCRGSSWNVSSGGDGAVTVSFEGRFADWAYTPPQKLPLSFRLEERP
jgi:hypothetical protein